MEHQILPPRIEDAGLEECALPPESIREAFFKAAFAVKSRATSVLSADDDDAACVKDPWPTGKDASDVVIGVMAESEPEGPCAVVKGIETGADEVKVCDWEEVRDKVIVGGEGEILGEEGKACVDSLQGLGLEDDIKTSNDADEEEKEKEGKRPTLVEGFA
ncbi:uncharacterized protein LOC129288747 [Prosopis cineraria]|uniref:uncharacterized protein LOC129288747 n=1 Tax=Prosopis cineraria TaxID=364024 RepID=UPI002410160D|nr:uncharacterized protein LOC129288747 [Prosopis cineraria]